ncbi:MAG TPA: hypothetical protein PLV51_06630 [Lentimicrobium sp.]|nr:hypothetical protein [Lentimicrobium sp.]
MKLFINQIEFQIYRGAKVMDAVRAYYTTTRQDVPAILPPAFDRYGNLLEPDGELLPEQRVFIFEPQFDGRHD